MDMAKLAGLLAVLIVCLTLSVVIGDLLTRIILNRRFPTPPDHTPDLIGRTIGRLERIAVSGAILLGQSGLIAIVIAIKGLGRFPELQKPQDSTQFAAKFIIGTFSSMIWAILMGVIGLVCIRYWDLNPWLTESTAGA